MSYDFCLGCGVLLAPNVYDCPVCGFDNDFCKSEELFIDDDLLYELDIEDE